MMVQFHPMHRPGYGPGYSITSGARNYRAVVLRYIDSAVYVTEENIHKKPGHCGTA